MKPTEQECLQLLDKATATVQTDRAGHANIQLALSILAEAIAPKPDPRFQPADGIDPPKA